VGFVTIGFTAVGFVTISHSGSLSSICGFQVDARPTATVMASDSDSKLRPLDGVGVAACEFRAES